MGFELELSESPSAAMPNGQGAPDGRLNLGSGAIRAKVAANAVASLLRLSDLIDARFGFDPLAGKN
jgi:hypothetical protein